MSDIADFMRRYGAMIDDFRSAQHDQWLREQRASGGNDTERKLFYDPDNGGERRLNLHDWMGWHKQDKHPDEDEHVHEYSKGYDLGRAHGEKKWINSDELAEHTARSPHPEHFGEGYQMGLEHALSDDDYPGRHRVAVLLGHNDRRNEQLVAPAVGFKRIVAHVSGNSIDVLHCPFCGSGALIARSDGTIECNYCTAVFTVQVQPQFPAFPMTSQGQPYAWPGQPDPATVVSPGGSPMAPGDPMATGPGGAPGDLAAQPFSGSGPTDGTDDGGSDGPPWADGGDGDDDADDDPTAQIGGKSAPPFGKGKKSDKSDKKDDGKKGDNPFAKKKSYLTATGAVLDEDEYIRHLAIAHADDPARMASRVRAGR